MTRLLPSILAAAAGPAAAPPFAILHRHGDAFVDVLVGATVDVDRLADIPLDGDEVLALVPFRQVRERGFAAHDDGAPLRCLVVRDRERLLLEEAIARLPAEPARVADPTADLDDEAYAAIVRRVIDDEIGRGEGANFVIRRDLGGRIDTAPALAVLGWMRTLLEHERGAYWTFAIHAPGAGGAVSAAGATPERHVSSIGGTVSMNPISGTFRHPAAGGDADDLVAFLSDVKEREELVMVVDEELKMMSAVCPDGGRMHGPFLKRMSRLTHTEYLLEGTSTLDPREVLRRTMFAPTVTGSPMGNACTVIARHETTGRGYYAGVLARFSPTAEGYDLDAPILIRTAYVDDRGLVRVPVGATLVRHSDPLGEVAETHAKAAGVLAAIGAIARSDASGAPIGELDESAAGDPRVARLLAERDRGLASFWRAPQAPRPRRGLDVLVIDAGDDFTTMLAHQLHHLGFDVRRASWQDAPIEASDDLVVFGPGPGDPRDPTDPRIARLRELVAARIDQRRPLLAVCLSHQVLADLAGLALQRLPAPRQGLALPVDLFGERGVVGFYNTFTAVAEHATVTPRLGLTVAAAPDGAVVGLRGPGLASVQGHLESVLSSDGVRVLERAVDDVLASAAALAG